METMERRNGQANGPVRPRIPRSLEELRRQGEFGQSKSAEKYIGNSNGSMKPTAKIDLLAVRKELTAFILENITERDMAVMHVQFKNSKFRQTTLEYKRSLIDKALMFLANKLSESGFTLATSLDSVQFCDRYAYKFTLSIKGADGVILEVDGTGEALSTHPEGQAIAVTRAKKRAVGLLIGEALNGIVVGLQKKIAAAYGMDYNKGLQNFGEFEDYLRETAAKVRASTINVAEWKPDFSTAVAIAVYRSRADMFYVLNNSVEAKADFYKNVLFYAFHTALVNDFRPPFGVYIDYNCHNNRVEARAELRLGAILTDMQAEELKENEDSAVRTAETRALNRLMRTLTAQHLDRYFLIMGRSGNLAQGLAKCKEIAAKELGW